ncbi:malonate transporter subunit MadL [Priestia megaterium]|uniref:malonate transporter subunit MadL n=1 Tax=Priestia megaterium TaxID=1404 RepID=UPI00244916DC|nr:malonate transporter subunit MadL [Priestia megaterium]MDH2454249.1 malonate transporter subunit MadL [Priestia megaterium]MDL5153706.1 malonate transporter subunit MadL [Priestia megaterium]
MIIFGVALLSICMLIGVIVGDALGGLMGVEANVGGVGVSMLLLVLAVDYLKKKNKLQVKSEEGIAFWGGIYIPIVVAMSAQQNVVAALDGGGMALLAGVVVVVVGFLSIPFISRIGEEAKVKEQEIELSILPKEQIK